MCFWWGFFIIVGGGGVVVGGVVERCKAIIIFNIKIIIMTLHLCAILIMFCFCFVCLLLLGFLGFLKLTHFVFVVLFSSLHFSALTCPKRRD